MKGELQLIFHLGCVQFLVARGPEGNTWRNGLANLSSLIEFVFVVMQRMVDMLFELESDPLYVGFR